MPVPISHALPVSAGIDGNGYVALEFVDDYCDTLQQHTVAF